jgi:hypothetical protein
MAWPKSREGLDGDGGSSGLECEKLAFIDSEVRVSMSLAEEFPAFASIALAVNCMRNKFP